MTWKFAYTPMIWPSALTALMMLTLSIFAWRRRSVPGALPFVIAALFAAFWTAGSALQIAAIDVAAKILWFKFQGIWQLPTITALTCFLLEFAWPGRYLTRRNLFLLSIPCLLFLGMAVTNESYHLAWYGSPIMEWSFQIAPRETGRLSLMDLG
jgi:hypothetical protein